MPGPSARDEADRALLARAVQETGHFIRERIKKPFKIETKPGDEGRFGKREPSPVTDVDLEADRIIHGILMGARPDYGWLSEESENDPARLTRPRVFVIDPVDGTTALIKRKPEFTVVAAVVEDGQPVAAAIYNPLTEELFLAGRFGGATLNGAPMQVSQTCALEDARMFGGKDLFTHPSWPEAWPTLTHVSRASLGYRLALIACGEADGYLTLGPKYEWDTAAGLLLVQEAGGIVTDRKGRPLTYNQPDPRGDSLIAANPALHGLILNRVRGLVLPGDDAGA